MDDDYFRVALTLRQDVAGHPGAQRSLAAAVRGLNRPQQRGFAKAIVAAVTERSVVSDSGLYVGQAPAIVVDLERLRRTAARIVRGLYFNAYGKRHSGLLRVWGDEDFEEVSHAVRTEVLRDILLPLLSSPKRTIGDDVFGFWGVRDAQIPEASAWMLEFFGTIRFLGLTVPTGAAPVR